MTQTVDLQMRLAARPKGMPQLADFALVSGSVRRPEEGEILVRNHYLSVDPTQRGWANDHVAAFPEAADELTRLALAGELVYDGEVLLGLEQAPPA